MTASMIWFIFCKELSDTLRDRRTLIFMLLIPALAVPGLIFGLTRFVLHISKQQAVAVVKIAVDERTRNEYARIVHGWFRSTELAAELPGAILQRLDRFIQLEEVDQTEAASDDVLTEPAAFDRWMHEVTRRAREILTVMDLPASSPTNELAPALQDQVVDFYKVAIRGLGLVEFVDLSSIPPAPADVDLPPVPEGIGPLDKARDLVWAIKTGLVHGYLQVSGGVDRLEADDRRVVEVTLLHDSTLPLSNESYKRVDYVVGKAGEGVVHQRLDLRDLGPEFLQPLVMTPAADLATTGQIALNAAGGLLPYIVIVFAFLGAVYPAIDLGAGEKERNTLETLLLAPSTRTEIAFGKLLVIFTTSLVAAFLGLASIVLSVKHMVPPILLEKLDFRVEPAMAILVGLLVIPLAAALSAVCLAISVFARSFKEAQNYITPLQFVVILPAVAPMIPGLEMNLTLAFVPFVNVSMLAKDFLKGDVNWGYYLATLASSLGLSAVGVAFCVRQFSREHVLFRT